MSAKYQIRSLAQSDLESIWLYTLEEWGVDQADSYLESIFKRFDWLTDNPTVGKPRDDLKQGFLCFPEGMHLVFYKIQNKHIEIISVPHQNMDIIEYLTRPE